MTLSVYIHLPFCASKCDYCDFFSVPDTDTGIHKRVLDTVIEELGIRLAETDSPRIESVFIGGGTPSVIEHRMFGRFLERLNRLISPLMIDDYEFSCEANVGSCTAEFMNTAYQHGINRLSLGVQSFSKKTLNEIGRRCEVDDIYGSVAGIRERWPGIFSLDLISGTGPECFGDLCMAVELEPEHLSVYQLTVEEGTALQRLIDSGRKLPPDDAFQSAAIEKSISILHEAGYHRYEVSNFERGNNPCRHNLRYWNMRSYIGAGPSAVSSLYLPDKQIRTTNTRDIDQYINQDLKAPGADIRAVELISRLDFMIEHYLMGCRLSTGPDEEIFTERFGAPPSSFIPETVKKWSEKGLLENGRPVLNEEGLLFLDAFLADLYDEITSGGRGQ